MKREPIKAEPGDNRRMLLNALQGAERPKVDTKDIHAVQERMTEYIQYCVENDVAPSVAGCANWMGIHRYTLEAWFTGAKATPEHQKLAAHFYAILEDVWAQKMDTGNINPVSGIFMGKALYGLKDTQEIVVQHTAKADQLSIADLIAESKRLPGAETVTVSADGEKTQNAIDADFRVVEESYEVNPGLELAEERKRKQEERHEELTQRTLAKMPEQKAARKEYLKQYFQEHKEEYNERHRKSRAKQKTDREILERKRERDRESKRRKYAEKKKAKLEAEQAALNNQPTV